MAALTKLYSSPRAVPHHSGLAGLAVRQPTSTTKVKPSLVASDLTYPIAIPIVSLNILHIMAQDPVQLIAQADKAYSSAGSGWNWRSLTGSKTDNLENAAELYIRAAAAYRAKRAMRDAGNAYEKVSVPDRFDSIPFPPLSVRPFAPRTNDYIQAANIQGTKLSEPDDMANTLQEAFKVYREDYPEDAARCLSQAIDHYVYKGNYRRAATQKQSLAEMYEEKQDLANARSAYSEAAQWYEDDNAPALASKLNLKAAEFAAMEGDYLDAVQRFEHVSKLTAKNTAMKLSLKIYLLNAGICHLALDIIGAKRALESYRELDPQFPQTDQYMLLADLTDIVEEGDSEAFVTRLKQFEDKRITVAPWQWAVFRRCVSHFIDEVLANCKLYRINDQLKEKEEDFS